MKTDNDIISSQDDEALEKPILPEDRPVPGVAPEDKGDIVYYCFLFLGFCALLPWSCILNCFDFMASYVKQLTFD